MYNPYLRALERMMLFMTALAIEVSVILLFVLFVVFGFGVNAYAAGGLVCCTVLLGWWGYFHGRGPGEGIADAP